MVIELYGRRADAVLPTVVLYHAATKTGVKADLARREAELEAKKKAFGASLSP